jgi:hypothetical protein
MRKVMFFVVLASMFLVVFSAAAAEDKCQEYEIMDIELASNFARLACPDLAKFPSAETALAAIFDAKGKVRKDWLQNMQISVIALSKGRVELSLDEKPLVFFETPFVNFIVYNKESKKSRKYIILKGVDQIACEIEEVSLPKNFSLGRR